jgi:hypothetical protein
MFLPKRTAKQERLHEFFLSEVRKEVRSGFARLARVPDSRVKSKIQYFFSLGKSDRAAFLDCCAYWASSQYGFVINAPRHRPIEHPFFERWSRGHWKGISWDSVESVPILRAMVQQYKIDRHRGVTSQITKKQFKRASSVRSVKAPELRKYVIAALKPLGHFETDKAFGDYRYWCREGPRKFFVGVDFAGRGAQFRYAVVLPEFKKVHPLAQFNFERALGFGLGDWNYIVEGNVDDVFSLFAELVDYCVRLPDRIRGAVR